MALDAFFPPFTSYKLGFILRKHRTDKFSRKAIQISETFAEVALAWKSSKIIWITKSYLLTPCLVTWRNIHINTGECASGVVQGFSCSAHPPSITCKFYFLFCRAYQKRCSDLRFANDLFTSTVKGEKRPVLLQKVQLLPFPGG